MIPTFHLFALFFFCDSEFKIVEMTSEAKFYKLKLCGTGGTYVPSEDKRIECAELLIFNFFFVWPGDNNVELLIFNFFCVAR